MSEEKLVPKLRFDGFNDKWSEVKLGDISTFLDNKRVPLKEDDRKQMKGKYPYYGASGIIDYINDYIFDEELILMGEDGANIVTRSSKLIFLAKGKYWVNNHAHVIKANNNINQYFLSESLERINYEKYNTGTAQPKLNREVCQKIKVKIPGYQEQNKIANFLVQIDQKIALLEQKHEKYQDFKKYLMQQIFAQKLRFDKTKDTQKEIQLGDVISIVNKRNKNNESLPVLSISNKLGFISQSEQFEDREVASSDKKNYKIVNKGEFAYNPARINVGSIAQLKTYEQGIISPMYIVFKIKYDELHPIFFENFLDSDHFRHEMTKRLEGSVRMILSAESLKNIKITVPPIEEQEKLSKVFSAFDKQIKITNYQLEKMVEFKKGLLQQMFV